MNRRFFGFLLFFLAWLCGVGQAFAQESAKQKENRYALLVGCTKYPNLKPSFQLRGPANDVLLLRDLLVGRFAFSKDKVVILSENTGGDDLRPTRGNIEREFKRLAKIARPGDKVVILLSGHGSQQPVENADDPENFEPDGLDEIFLPADVGTWDGDKGKITNAIIDDVIRVWLKEIQKRKAAIWIIVDTCNAGTMIRGANEEVLRGIPAEQLVPKEALEKAKEKAAKLAVKTRGTAERPRFHLQDTAPDLVAVYAVQAGEPTVEMPLPRGSPERKPYGLLTYTLVQVLTQAAEPMTYAELTQRVHAQYVQWGRSYPIPLVEGKSCHQEVLALRAWPERSRILLAATEDGFKVNAGAIQGITPGSVLAVYPPAGQKSGDKIVGNVKVTRVRMLEAEVEPCSLDKVPTVKDLPTGGRCQLVFHDYGLDRLKVAVAGVPKKDEEAIRQVMSHLKQLANDKGTILELTKSESAEWLIQVADGKASLVPIVDQVARGAKRFASDGYSSHTVDSELSPWLEDRLGRIHRCQNLLKIAGASRGKAERGGAGLDVGIDMVKYRDEADREGQVHRWDQAGFQFEKGDIIGFRLHNRSHFTVDVTLLFVDAEFGIKPFFPPPATVTDNRILPRKSISTPRGRVTAKTIGLEHMALIAVKGEGQPIDFLCLAQPSLERSRDLVKVRGQENRTLDSPLGQLFQNALYGHGGTRGLQMAVFDEYALRLLSWRVH